MFKVDKNFNITITKGDTGYLRLKAPRYKIKEGDTVKFTVGYVQGVGVQKEKKFQIEGTKEEGIARIKIEPKHTQSMDIGKYHYDIEITTTEKDVFTVIGPCEFEIVGGVTVD